LIRSLDVSFGPDSGATADTLSGPLGAGFGHLPGSFSSACTKPERHFEAEHLGVLEIGGLVGLKAAGHDACRSLMRCDRRPMKRHFRNTCLRKRRSVQNEARRRNLVNIDYSIRSGFPFLRRRLMGMLTLFESRQLAVRG
jgi:hypothetical protein